MHRHQMAAFFCALLLCVAAPALAQQDIAHDGVLYTIENGIAYAVGEAVEIREEGQVVQDGVLYMLENGFAYATEYWSGVDATIIPLSVHGLPVSLERMEYQSPQSRQLILAEGTQQVAERQFTSSACEELILPSTLRDIGPNAFSWMYNLKALTIPEGVERIGEYAFYYGAMETVSLPSTATSIDPTAFAECEKLKAFTVHPDNPNYATVDGALYSKDLKTLYCFPQGYGTTWTMPDGTVTISEQAFGYNRMLQSLTIGEGVQTIGESMLTSCEALTTLRLSTTVATIADNSLPRYKLRSLEVPEGNPYFQNVDGAVYSLQDSALIFYPRGVETVFSVLPGTKRIGARTFSGDDILQSISLPLGLESIGDGAFGGCTSLVSISLPLTLEYIGDYAFYDCIALERLMLPPGLRSIGDGALSNCTGIQALHIPASVTEIGDYAFEYAPQMTITADAGTLGAAHVRTGMAVADPLGTPYQTVPADSEAYVPLVAGIVNNPGTDDQLALYELADTDSNLIASYPNGTTVIIQGDQGEWLYVTVGYLAGYIRADAVMRTEALHTLFSPLLVEVRAGPLDIMYTPLATDTYIERLEGGTVLSVSSACGTWYQVVWNGLTGYVPTNQVSVTQYEDLGGGGEYGVVENPNARDRLHLRDKASTDGRSIARFFNGTQVEILGTQGDWYHVQVAGLEGYMMAKFVARVSNQ